jgi:hypothetical protein
MIRGCLDVSVPSDVAERDEGSCLCISDGNSNGGSSCPSPVTSNPQSCISELGRRHVTAVSGESADDFDRSFAEECGQVGPSSS